MEFNRVDKAPREDVSRPGQSIVLRAEGLRKAFDGHVVLADVSLELRAGSVVLLRGANGSGKTTLLNILTGNIEADSGTIELYIDGEHEVFRFPRSSLQQLNPADHFTPERLASERVGRTWQDLRLFETQTLTDNIGLAAPNQDGEYPVRLLLHWGRVRDQERANRRAVHRLLARVGLRGREDSWADQVSLGQAKRVGIARAIHANARILFLDEPLSGLDEAGVAEVMDLLTQLARELAITLVIVEHVSHIPPLLEIVDTIWTLDRGELIEEPLDESRAAQTVYAQGIGAWLRSIAPPGAEIVHRQLPRGAVLSSVLLDSRSGPQPAIEVDGMVVRRGRRLVIGSTNDVADRFGFSMRVGELAVLQAPNGWGKTTLLEGIAGVLPIEAGSIRLFGEGIGALPAWDRARRGLCLLRARDSTFPALSVAEALRLARVEKMPTALLAFSERRVGQLSGGERQRVALEAALGGTGARVLLLDEPFAMLDTAGITTLLDRLVSTPRRTTLLAVPTPGPGRD